jgi:hypothetical protein
MKLMVSRLAQLHHGFDVSVQNADGCRTICTIDGNRPHRVEPVVLLSLDPYVLYGLSHPEVVSAILSRGPQPLIAQKQMAHKLFEHGMKASWEKVVIGSNQFLTTLGTFYEIFESSTISVITHGDKASCTISIPGYRPVCLAYSNQHRSIDTMLINSIVGTSTYLLKPDAV